MQGQRIVRKPGFNGDISTVESGFLRTLAGVYHENEAKFDI